MRFCTSRGIPHFPRNASCAILFHEEGGEGEVPRVGDPPDVGEGVGGGEEGHADGGDDGSSVRVAQLPNLMLLDGTWEVANPISKT